MAFLSFEGIDGCGKSTQLELLRAHLQARGQRVLATREPGGAPLSEAIRDLVLQTRAASTRGAEHGGDAEKSDAERAAEIAPRAELLLFAAARTQHVEETIRPALARGAIVLCDRFTDSTEAYQGGGLGLDEKQIAWLNEYATGGLFPDLTFWLDVEPHQALQRRAAARGTSDRIEERGLIFQEKVRRSFATIAAREPQRIVSIDGSQNVEEIHAEIVRVLAEKF